MPVHVKEAERRRLGMAPRETILLAAQKSRVLSFAVATSIAAAGGAFLAAGWFVWGGGAVGMALGAFAARALAGQRYYLTQTRILVRHGGQEEWHELADVAFAQVERGLTTDCVLVTFHDGRPPLELPDVPNAQVVVAHILQVAASADAPPARRPLGAEPKPMVARAHANGHEPRLAGRGALNLNE